MLRLTTFFTALSLFNQHKKHTLQNWSTLSSVKVGSPLGFDHGHWLTASLVLDRAAHRISVSAIIKERDQNNPIISSAKLKPVHVGYLKANGM